VRPRVLGLHEAGHQHQLLHPHGRVHWRAVQHGVAHLDPGREEGFLGHSLAEVLRRGVQRLHLALRVDARRGHHLGLERHCGRAAFRELRTEWTYKPVARVSTVYAKLFCTTSHCAENGIRLNSTDRTVEPHIQNGTYTDKQGRAQTMLSYGVNPQATARKAQTACKAVVDHTSHEHWKANNPHQNLRPSVTEHRAVPTEAKARRRTRGDKQTCGGGQSGGTILWARGMVRTIYKWDLLSEVESPAALKEFQDLEFCCARVTHTDPARSCRICEGSDHVMVELRKSDLQTVRIVCVCLEAMDLRRI
jgi:hypothetical protein